MSQTEVDGIGALASPIQPIYAGFIGVGVRLAESKNYRRRRQAGHVHLRRLDSPAGLGGGRPSSAGAYACVSGLCPDPIGRPAAAGCGAHP